MLCPAGCAGRPVERPDDSRLLVQVLDRLALIPDMIPGGQRVDPQVEHLAGRVARNAGPARQIFTVGQDDVGGVALAQAGKEMPDRFAARLSVNVADEEDAHYLA